jgi:hypothetical protein
MDFSFCNATLLSRVQLIIDSQILKCRLLQLIWLAKTLQDWVTRQAGAAPGICLGVEQSSNHRCSTVFFLLRQFIV